MLRIRQEIVLSQGLSISNLTDQLWPDGYLVSGEASEAEVVLLVEEGESGGDEAGKAAVTHLITPASGVFSFRVPAPGNYQLRARASGRDEVVLKFLVSETDTVLPSIKLPPRATLKMPTGQIMRLGFRGLDGTRDPDFIDTRTDHQVKQADRVVRDGSSRYVFLSGDATDPDVITLTPGKYQVTASRGPEFSVNQTIVTIEPGQQTELNLVPPARLLTTPGYLSADFHVHSGKSFDNNLGIVPRIKSYIAQGAEVLVATEHDTIFNFTAIIESMGLSSELKTVTGTELTNELGNPASPFGLGHANIFPLEAMSLKSRRGAPAHEHHRWRDIIAELRSAGEHPLVQLNHPLGEDPGKVAPSLYLSHLSVAGVPFNPHQPLDSAPNNVMLEVSSKTGIRDIDFDIIEVENGNRWGNRYRVTRDAWFSLLRQGVHMVAAANSDSHSIRNGDIAANVRNMVFTGSAELSDYSEADFLQGISDGNLYGTNGPLLNISLNGTPIGGLASGSDPVLSLGVSAIDWVPVDQYILYMNGEKFSEGALVPGEHLSIPLVMENDAFVTVEVTGPMTELSREVIGNVPPFAFTNPIYYDADGDGKWTPIGLPLPE
jgi:hypothetical protein